MFRIFVFNPLHGNILHGYVDWRVYPQKKSHDFHYPQYIHIDFPWMVKLNSFEMYRGKPVMPWNPIFSGFKMI